MNYQRTQLIQALKKKGLEDSANLWKRIALDLEKPSRNRRAVNLSHINAVAKENEIIVVPGKVLGNGELEKKVTIAAFSFSTQAKEKIAATKSDILTIEEFVKKGMKPADVRIIG